MCSSDLVANFTGESIGNPADHHWDVSHMSQGIAQWDPPRSAAIKKQFGKEPKDMTVPEQMRAAMWEMQTRFPKTWAALQGNDANQMVNTLVRDYERPAKPDQEVERRLGHYNSLAGTSAPTNALYRIARR